MEIDFDALFAKARAADIVAVAEQGDRTKLYRSGRRMRGECPCCGASKGKRADGAFSADPQAKLFTCWSGNAGCGEGGDVVRLEQLLRGGTPREAAERLAGAPPTRLPVEAGRAAPQAVARGGAPAYRDEGRFQLDVAVETWCGARPGAGSLVERYLAARGLRGVTLERMLGQLRFHPHAHHHSQAGRPVRLPAMVGHVRTPEGPTCGVHVTYLAPDGRAKAAVNPAKRMWGPMALNGVRGGVWLSSPRSSGPLVEGEGIESTGSAAVLLDRPCRMVAALSLNAMQGGWLADKWGRVNPDVPAGDPERPAFTWPEPEDAPWGEVILAIDRDMATVKVKARKACGGTWERPLDAEARARVCAALAEQAWRRAGATRVRAIGPAPGRDFNDELGARG